MFDAPGTVELLILAILVALASERARVPYTTGLVLCGALVGLTRMAPVHVDRDLLLLAFLPPLLFKGALDMDLELLREQWFPVLVYSLAGTVIGAAVMGGVVWFVAPMFGEAQLPFITALFLGTILSATDPVSVLATFKQHAVDKRLAMLLEAESVFNDGIAVVLYLVLHDAMRPGGTLPTVASATASVIAVAGGAAVIGLSTGWLFYRALRRIDDHLLEVMMSVVLAWGSYLLAERFHSSGVLACACAGLVLGNYGRVFSMSATTRVTLAAFWDVAAFIANSLVFILIGMQMNRASVPGHAGLIGAAVVGMVFSRAVVIYGLAPIVRACGWHLPRAWSHAMNVGGLRGSIPIALALGLSPAFPMYDAVLAAVFGAAFFSLTVQALAVKPTLARLGLLQMPAIQLALEVRTAREIGLRAALEELARVREQAGLSTPLHRALAAELEWRLDLLRHHPPEGGPAAPRKGEELSLRSSLLETQRAALEEASRRGVISGEAMEQVRLELDVELAGFREGRIGSLDVGGQS